MFSITFNVLFLKRLESVCVIDILYHVFNITQLFGMYIMQCMCARTRGHNVDRFYGAGPKNIRYTENILKKYITEDSFEFIIFK